MMFKKIIFLAFLAVNLVSYSQVGINTTAPDPSAALDIFSNEQGVLLPQLTTVERDGITDPANGLLIYNTDSDEFQYNTGTTTVPIWQRLENTSSSASIGASVKYSNTDETTNMNADPAINAPLLGTLEWNDNTTLYTANTATNGITVNEAGRYRIVVNISLNNPSARDRMAPEMRIAVNGLATGTYSSTGYIRSNQGHQDSSLHITEVLELTAGQIITVSIVESARNSDNATNIVTMRAAGAANIYIEKLQ